MARKPPQPNAENCSLAELEVAARAAPHHAGYNRLTAIRALLRGVPHEIAAQLACVSARTLAAWTGAFYALEFTHTDTEVFRCLLEHANQDVPRPRKRNLLIMDNAGWHKTRSLPWGAFEPVYLPQNSPDHNPTERLWLLLKAEWFSDFVARDRQALLDRLDQALNWVTARAADNSRTCAIPQ